MEEIGFLCKGIHTRIYMNCYVCKPLLVFKFPTKVTSQDRPQPQKLTAHYSYKIYYYCYHFINNNKMVAHFDISWRKINTLILRHAYYS